MKNYTLCEFECPLCDKCARYLPELDRTNTDHMAVNPYDHKRNRCGYFEPYDDVQPDPQIVENILQRIKDISNAREEDKAII